MRRAVNEHAHKEVQNVLDYLWEQRGKAFILGQHTQTMAMEELHDLERVTGKQPALLGFELLGYSPNINYEDADEACLVEVAEAKNTLTRAWEWAEKGGLITFTWHWFSPIGGRDKSFFTVNTDFDAEKAITEGTEEYYALLADMDYCAGLLRPFCDAHIPILWRPFHECEGKWFWWGAKGPAIARVLFQMMYERFTKRHHLDNLIWVFNSPDQDSYPGDAYVDILTRDLYPPAHEHRAHEDRLEELRQLAEGEILLAIAEIGTLPNVGDIVEKQVPWSYYMNWSKEFAEPGKYTSEEYLREAYGHPGAVTLDKLPKLY